MQNHNLFYIIAAFILVAAATMSFFVTWASSPFFLFALAAALRGTSLHKKHNGFKTAAYIVFFLGIGLLIYYVVIYNLLQ